MLDVLGGTIKALNSLEKYGSLSVEADELPPSLRECFFGNT